MVKIKCAAAIALFLLVGIVASVSREFTTIARDDPILAEISKYRSWKKLTAEPIRVGANVAPMG